MTLILSFIALGFLICIHELGHLLAARMVGMKVEAFGIGFGRPICSFVVADIPVRIGWIPFGGYVKIAGMEDFGEKKTNTEKTLKNADVESQGFFAKSPRARIWVALAGPLANILFCFFVFTIIWVGGGRAKPYSFASDRIGLLDPKSSLYQQNVRAGDRIVSYGTQPLASSKDHVKAAMTSVGAQDIEVESLLTGKTRTIRALAYSSSQLPSKEFKTFGVLSPASFIVWMPQGAETAKALSQERSFRPQDRIVWVNGEAIFSLEQLRALLNKDEVYLTIMRGDKKLSISVPRCKVSDLKLTSEVRGELTDWMYEAKVVQPKLASLFFIPYNVSQDCVVETPLEYTSKVDASEQSSQGLKPKDVIIAVSGAPVTKTFEVVRLLQKPSAAVVVQRGASYKKTLPLKEIDQMFVSPYRSDELDHIVEAIGSSHVLEKKGSSDGPYLELLSHVPLFTIEEMENTVSIAGQHADSGLYLGLLGIQDVSIVYNPSPIVEAQSIFDEIRSTLYALFSGTISPKLMSGPVGIVQLIQQQWAFGLFDVLFWLGAISLNLALLNLLPLPVLDGGHVVMSLLEICTFRKISPKISAKIIAPFAFLLFGLLIYLTYNDIVRIIQQITS